MEGIILLLILLVIIIVGTPIAFSLGLSAVVGILLFLAPKQLIQLTNIVVSQGTSGTLIVAPMFILMAEILIVSGISKDIFTAATRWFSRLPGGLALNVIATSTGFASVSGSSGATVATIGSMSVPEMLKQGYSPRLVSGSVVSGGTLGILIPPSLVLIIFGVVTEVSIAKLFVAGIIPGIIIALLLAGAIVVYAKIKPDSAPQGRSYSWKERWAALFKVLPVILIALFIMGSLYTGIATPTELAALGTVASLILALAMRRLTWGNFKEALIRSAKTSSRVLLLIIGGMTFGFVVTYLNIPEIIVSSIMHLELNRWVIYGLFVFILLLLGCILDPIVMIILTMPFMFPVIVELGFDPIWFGIIVAITAEIGLISPPIGMNLFILNTVAPDLKLEQITLGSLPFILIFILAIVLFSVFPQLITLLL